MSTYSQMMRELLPSASRVLSTAISSKKFEVDSTSEELQLELSVV